MFRIMLCDYNFPSYISGLTRFFTDDIMDFKSKWEKIESDEDCIDRFNRSLNGEFVSDLFMDKKECNIVTEDKSAGVIFEVCPVYEDETFTLKNVYGCESIIHVDSAVFTIRGIKFLGEYFLVGKYRLSGVCQKVGNVGYTRRFPYGNNILKCKYDGVEVDNSSDFLRGDDFVYTSEDTKQFENDSIESICYVTIQQFDDLQELKSYELTTSDLVNLMGDICGEAG